jgi:hypothetical protein
MILPAGWHSLTARIVTHDVVDLVNFLTVAFGAEGELLDEWRSWGERLPDCKTS